MKFLRTYNLLKAYGHTPSAALGIVLSARRGDNHSRQWIYVVFAARH